MPNRRTGHEENNGVFYNACNPFCLAACDNQPQTGSPSNSETSVNGNGDNIVQNEDITTKDIITPTKGDGDISFDFESCTVTLNSGYEMPIMGLGTYSLSDEECYNSVTALLEAGGWLIDTAYMYHNEAAVGRAVRDSDVRREEIFVITKLYPSQFGNPEAAIEEALEKMDIDYIDMMLLHHPGEGDVEAYLAMEKAVAEGKIRSIGLSNR